MNHSTLFSFLLVYYVNVINMQVIEVVSHLVCKSRYLMNFVAVGPMEVASDYVLFCCAKFVSHNYECILE